MAPIDAACHKHLAGLSLAASDVAPLGSPVSVPIEFFPMFVLKIRAAELRTTRPLSGDPHVPFCPPFCPPLSKLVANAICKRKDFNEASTADKLGSWSLKLKSI